ncbi:hypothetical protein SCLCIDRAFT_439606 [Scleroderma citrinum Foug A]|uniref:Uncharacterized protein n=1 Tax=Scleroderma citrinum Foug A TaxID=1036808 RepID=A0A0C2ZL47_9AGAM|nr:hypothetical protein SCLCIDRAFT_439606 [Scleroderma citrinum Foug A]
MDSTLEGLHARYGEGMVSCCITPLKGSIGRFVFGTKAFVISHSIRGTPAVARKTSRRHNHISKFVISFCE